MNYRSAERPQSEYRAEQATVPARDLRKGDVILRGGKRLEVAGRKLATKYVYVDLAGEASVPKLGLDEGVLVERQVETDESIERGRAWFRNERCYRTFMTIKERFRDSRAKVAERLASGELVSPSEIDELLKWQFLEGASAGYRARGEDPDFATTWSELYEDLERRFTKDLLEGHNDPTWSGGFSAANCERQAMQQAERWFISELQYF